MDKSNGRSMDVDNICEQVKKDLDDRVTLGYSKYKTTLSEAKLTKKQLLQHAYEEALDLAQYLRGALNNED